MTNDKLILGICFKIGNGNAWLKDGDLYFVFGGGTAYVKESVNIDEEQDFINLHETLCQDESVILLKQTKDYHSTFIY